MDWPLIIAALINSVLVLIAVQGLKNYVMPFLRVKYPWVLPIIATVAGPLLGMLTQYLSAMLGYPIDLSAIIGVLTGLSAVAGYSVLNKAGKTKFGKLKLAA